LCHCDFASHLIAGERARIHPGALTGRVGVLVCEKNNLRIVLILDLIVQSASVEVGMDENEPLRM
jgi:hypothetical protein